MVKLLEDRLGVALFQRQANRLALMPAVRAYQGGLTQILRRAQRTSPTRSRCWRILTC